MPFKSVQIFPMIYYFFYCFIVLIFQNLKLKKLPRKTIELTKVVWYPCYCGMCTCSQWNGFHFFFGLPHNFKTWLKKLWIWRFIFLQPTETYNHTTGKHTNIQTHSFLRDNVVEISSCNFVVHDVVYICI